MKTGILLVNLGTPDEPNRSAVYRYLKQFLLDPRVIDINAVSRNLLVRGIIAPFRSGASFKLYQKLWTPEGSPIKVYGEKLTVQVQELLGEKYVVALGMRYQNPSLDVAINKLLNAKVKKIVVFPLFPHYASASTGSALEEVMRIISKELVIPEIAILSSYHDFAPMIKIFADNARVFKPETFDHILFSFHGLPQRQMIKADRCGNHCFKKEKCCETLTDDNYFCYSAQCHDTAYKLAAELGIPKEKYTICYQSRLGKAPWIPPYTTDILKYRATQGDKKMLVFSAAFVADCLETTVEITQEYQEEWHELTGGTLTLVPSLNDNPAWAKAIVELIRSKTVLD